jgi:hypothetical protein
VVGKKATARNDENEDSSRLSTEFYEEYYRLINSIKKGGEDADGIVGL